MSTHIDTRKNVHTPARTKGCVDICLCVKGDTYRGKELCRVHANEKHPPVCSVVKYSVENNEIAKPSG